MFCRHLWFEHLPSWDVKQSVTEFQSPRRIWSSFRSKMLESSQDGMKRVRRVLLTNVSSSEGTIQLQPVSSFLSPWICSICCCTSVCSSLSPVKAQYKWADITRPQARGFLQIETDSGDADKEEQNGNRLNSNEVQKKQVYKNSASGGQQVLQFLDHKPREEAYIVRLSSVGLYQFQGSPFTFCQSRIKCSFSGANISQIFLLLLSLFFLFVPSDQSSLNLNCCVGSQGLNPPAVQVVNFPVLTFHPPCYAPPLPCTALPWYSPPGTVEVQAQVQLYL